MLSGFISPVSPGPNGPGVMPFNDTSGMDVYGIKFNVAVLPPAPQKTIITLQVFEPLAPGIYTVTLP